MTDCTNYYDIGRLPIIDVLNTMLKAQKEIDRLRAENEALKKSARHFEQVFICARGFVEKWDEYDYDDLRNAINEAMKDD